MICVKSLERDDMGRVIGERWCATFKKTTRYQEHVRTLCGMVVTAPGGFEIGKPDCPECLSKLKVGE
jgi:hypothetical protein